MIDKKKAIKKPNKNINNQTGNKKMNKNANLEIKINLSAGGSNFSLRFFCGESMALFLLAVLSLGKFFFG